MPSLALLLSVDVNPTSEFRRWHNQYGCVGSILCRAFSGIFNVEQYDIPVKGLSRLLKVVPFDRLGMVSY